MGVQGKATPGGYRKQGVKAAFALSPLEKECWDLHLSGLNSAQIGSYLGKRNVYGALSAAIAKMRAAAAAELIKDSRPERMTTLLDAHGKLKNLERR